MCRFLGIKSCKVCVVDYFMVKGYKSQVIWRNTCETKLLDIYFHKIIDHVCEIYFKFINHQSIGFEIFYYAIIKYYELLQFYLFCFSYY